MKVVKTYIPDTSLTGRFFPADYTDAFRCDIPEGAVLSPDDIQIAFRTDMPFNKIIIRSRLGSTVKKSQQKEA